MKSFNSPFNYQKQMFQPVSSLQRLEAPDANPNPGLHHVQKQQNTKGVSTMNNNGMASTVPSQPTAAGLANLTAHIDDTLPGKRCIDCQKIKPLSEFRKSSAKVNTDGYASRCKVCEDKYRSNRKAGIGPKWCETCRQYKPDTSFSRSRSCSDGLQSTCKPCDHGRRMGKRKIENPQRIADHIGDRTRKLGIPGPRVEDIRALFEETFNDGLDRETCERLLEEIGVPLVVDDFRGAICPVCGEPMIIQVDGKRFPAVWTRGNYATFDHILEISNGGTNDRDNLRIICRKCNYREYHRNKKKRKNSSSDTEE